MTQLNFSMKILQGGLILVVVGCVYLSMASVAYGANGINRQIPFYGELVDDKGKPLDGEFDMTFAIYDVPTGGSPLWDGEYTNGNGNPVTVDGGEFRVLLGSGTGNEFDSQLFIDDTHYLGITVESDNEMTPRERMGATGYAINSDMLDGLHAGNFLQQDTEIISGLSNETSILTLTQQGGGNLMSLYNNSSVDPIFLVLNSGRVIANSFESTSSDDANVFAGALSVVSGNASLIDAGVIIGNGNGISFGNGNGIGLYQDTTVFGKANELTFLPEGDATIDGFVHLTAPRSLILSANKDADQEPRIELNESGLTRMQNTLGTGDPRLELSFTNGVDITDGGLVVSAGELRTTDLGITIADGGRLRIGNGLAEEALDVDGVIRASSLAGFGDMPIGVDDDGNIIIDTFSDERLKENIYTIENALDMVLGLRGVRYEWKDADKFGPQTEVGFVAQEVQEVIPEVVRENGEYLTLNTKNILAVVVEAIKELSTKVEKYFSRTERLEQEVAELRAEIEEMKQGGDTSVDIHQDESVDVVVDDEITVEEIAEVAPDVVVEEETTLQPIEEMNI